MSAHDLTILLLALGVLLVAARAFGELARRLGQPEVMGEILAGIILGPTLFGRCAPGLHDALFPAQGQAAAALGGIQQLAVVLFLFVAGMEVNLSAVRRQGRRVALVAVGGLAASAALGFTVASLDPALLGGPEQGGSVFALFIAVAMAISALPVIARTLIDLGLYRSDIGMVVVPAAILQDLVGLLAFAVVLGLVDAGGGGRPAVVTTVILTCGFCALMLTAGRWCIDRLLAPIQAWLSWPGGVLGFAFALALLGAAFTEWIGLHAIFGAFVAGVALGDSPQLRQRTRATIEDVVRSFFAPLFFAGIALRVDLVAGFVPTVAATVLGLACVGKLLGCGLGARLAGLGWREAGAVALALNARGAMEIIVAAIALQFRIIREPTFVALVVTALATSVLAGPLIQRILGRRRVRGFLAFLAPRAFVRRLQARDRDAVIRELVAAAGLERVPADEVVQAVIAREASASTDLGAGLAVPHARIAGLDQPLVALGLHPEGVLYEGAGAAPVRLVVLVLTPAEAEDEHLGLLGDIVRSLRDPAVQRQVLEVRSYTEFVALLRAGTTAE